MWCLRVQWGGIRGQRVKDCLPCRRKYWQERAYDKSLMTASSCFQVFTQKPWVHLICMSLLVRYRLLQMFTQVWNLSYSLVMQWMLVQFKKDMWQSCCDSQDTPVMATFTSKEPFSNEIYKLQILYLNRYIYHIFHRLRC